MSTYAYADRQGNKYAIFHRNLSNKTWQHAYSLKDRCPICRGESSTIEQPLELARATA